MDETYLIPEAEDIRYELPPEDDAAELAGERSRRRREGRADDIIAMQAALCMVIASALIITNIFLPEKAGELFSRIRELSESPRGLFPNPLELLIGFISAK